MSTIKERKARCILCGNKYTSRGISRHLTTCLNKHEVEDIKAPKETYYHLKIQDKYVPYFWYQVLVTEDTTLDELDGFLRKWIECCGHLSQFIINNEYYESQTDLDAFASFYETKSMGYTLKEVLQDKVKNFIYEYDFGTTTTLEIQVKSVKQRKLDFENYETIRILAKNNKPIIMCNCGKEVAFICPYCKYEEDGNGWLCEDCAKEHDCGEEILMPYLNSPRTGMCGYYG